MGYANKQNGRWLLILLITGFTLASCATVEKAERLPLKADVKLEPRQSLLNWADVTHKSYYGLKGAVKSLTVKPVVLIGDSTQAVSDGWLLLFNKQGRLTSKSSLDQQPVLRTAYSYSESGVLKFVSSYKDEELWRTSTFIYQNNQVTKIQFADKKSKQQQTVTVDRQIVADGWFEIETLVGSPGLPIYSRYHSDNSLVWNSKGDINNGLGELYYIRTVDAVTSSDVLNSGTANMQEKGGYRYSYYKDGLLKAVESYNAHKNRLFHTTVYKYNDLALLVSEEKKVIDSSLFNQVVDESASYEYLQIDDKGNWTQRKLRVKTGFQQQAYLESRNIVYY